MSERPDDHSPWDDERADAMDTDGAFRLRNDDVIIFLLAAREPCVRLLTWAASSTVHEYM